MIFFAGLVTGAVLAFISVWYLNRETDTPEPIDTETERLNRLKRERSERLKELERQFDNLMNYKGEEQRNENR